MLRKGLMAGYPKCAKVAYWLFWIKVTQEIADSREALRPSSLSPWQQEIKLPLKGALPVPAGRKMSLSSETGIEGQEACINKSCYFFSNLPSKPKLCLNSLLITHPHLISLFFLVLSTFFVSSSKKHKSCLLWPLLSFYFRETTIHAWISFLFSR